MEDNEYKIKYESIEEFSRMASGNIARWEEELSEIEGCLKRLLNMETFQGESADAIRTYIQEIHITLLSAIRQCLREYSTRLLMYQSGYYKIDSAKGACLPEKEISDMGKHLQKQEEYLLERDKSIRSILDEISDILPLPVPSQEKLLSDIGEVIKKSNKLNVDVRCYESEKAKEVTEEFTPLTESIKKAIQKYTGQERQLYGYASGDADKVQEIAELNKKVMQSNWYMIDNGADIQAALKEKREQVEENQPVWYSQKYNAEEPDMHLILDLAGMMPAAGAVFDGINATWYLAEGDYTNAALSGMALIPVVGEFAGAGKAGLKGLKCADDIADTVKALDNTKDVAKAVDDMAGTARCLDDVIGGGNGLKIMDGKVVGKIPLEEYEKIRKMSIHNPHSDSMTLGKYFDGTIESGSYVAKAEATGDTYFSLGTKWDDLENAYGLTDKDMFELFNKTALDDAVLKGKTIKFVQDPRKWSGTALGEEWSYLQNKYGYTDLIEEGGCWYAIK